MERLFYFNQNLTYLYFPLSNALKISSYSLSEHSKAKQLKETIMFKKSAFVLIALIFATVSVGQTAEWMFDKPHTSIDFKVKHLMITNVHGSFDKFDGKVVYDPADPSSAQIDVTISTASVNTGNEKRDDHLRSADFFDVENHPEMTFKSTRFEKTEEGLMIVGNLTIRGITKEVQVKVDELVGPMKDPWGGTRIGATAYAKVDRFDYGLAWDKVIETGELVAGRTVKIILEVELIKQ
jgi:polyisoprenoid-binding protein YceI